MVVLARILTETDLQGKNQFLIAEKLLNNMPNAHFLTVNLHCSFAMMVEFSGTITKDSVLNEKKTTCFCLLPFSKTVLKIKQSFTFYYLNYSRLSL